MIENINEVNRLLIAIRQLTIDSRRGVLAKNLVRYCSDTVIGAYFPDHRQTIGFCLSSGLIRQTHQRIDLTSNGMKFLSLNRGKSYALNSKQRRFLVEMCFLKGRLSEFVRKILVQFSPDFETGLFQLSKLDDLPLKDNNGIFALMLQVGLVEERRDYYFIPRNYALDADKIIQAVKFLTQSELTEALENQKILGEIAERQVVMFEKERLKKSGYLVESESVIQVSKINVAAGYDILSFDGRSSEMNHNRFIEVKGSSSDRMHFYWSPNEMAAARKLKDRYWLYFQPNVSIDAQSAEPPIMIKNPIKNILKNKKFEMRCTEYEVEGSKAIQRRYQ
jgi:hypothetical protein